MKQLVYKDLPVFSFKTIEELHNWYVKNYKQESPIWIRYFKKATGKPTITHDQAIDEALCWGWIDGLGNSYDDESWVVRFTHRRPKSVWSQINVRKIEKLITDGRMQPNGQILVDAAKKDGRWESAYEGQSTMKIPEEFITLVKTDEEAWKFYTSLSKSNSYAIAWRITTTIGEEKKKMKMQKLFQMLKDKKTFH